MKTNLDLFVKRMDSLSTRVLVNEVKIKQQLAERVVEVVATSTPVLTGQAAGNWTTRLNQPASDWDEGPSAASNSIATAKAALAGLQPGQTIYITNNVPYIVKLNKNYSPQAPSQYVEMSVVTAIHSLGNWKLLSK